MPNFVFANNVNTTLAAPITTTTQTSITLTSSANLPTLTAGETFALTLNDAATQSVFEVLYATAISGATLTVERGQEGTAATTWLAGDYAYASVTAGILNALGSEGVDSINGKSGVVTIESTDGSVVVTEPGGNVIDLTVSGSHVTSLNGETGAVSAESLDGSVTITASGGNVNFQVSDSHVVSSLNSQQGPVVIESTDSSIAVNEPGSGNINLVVSSSAVVKSLNGQAGTVSIESTDGSLSVTASGGNVNLEWSPAQRYYGNNAQTNSSGKLTITVPYQVLSGGGTLQWVVTGSRPTQYQVFYDNADSNPAIGVVVLYVWNYDSGAVGASIGIDYVIITNNTPG